MAAAVQERPVQADLFAGPALAGFHQADEIITRDEERVLAAAIDTAGLAPFKFGAFEGNRMTASFGWRDDYDAARFEEARPIPDWLLPVRDRGAQASSAGFSAMQFSTQIEHLFGRTVVSQFEIRPG